MTGQTGVWRVVEQVYLLTFNIIVVSYNQLATRRVDTRDYYRLSGDYERNSENVRFKS